MHKSMNSSSFAPGPNRRAQTVRHLQELRLCDQTLLRSVATIGLCAAGAVALWSRFDAGLLAVWLSGTTGLCAAAVFAAGARSPEPNTQNPGIHQPESHNAVHTRAKLVGACLIGVATCWGLVLLAVNIVQPATVLPSLLLLVCLCLVHSVTGAGLGHYHLPATIVALLPTVLIVVFGHDGSMLAAQVVTVAITAVVILAALVYDKELRKQFRIHIERDEFAGTLLHMQQRLHAAETGEPVPDRLLRKRPAEPD